MAGRLALPGFSTVLEETSVTECKCVGEGLHGLAGMACLVVLLKQKHSRGFKNYQMAGLSLSESALLQPYVSEL